MSIKILSREHVYKSEAIKMADKKTPKRPKSRSFQEEEISLLITEWFKYPCLFDKGSKDYHDKNKREIARTHIARSLNEQLGFDKEVDSTKAITGKPETYLCFICLDHDVQKKIENLRTYFGKEYGKECETKPKSGSGAVQAFKSSWPWYESLKWLKDHIGQKESISNLVVNVDATTDSDGSNSSVITPITNKKGKKIKLSAEEKIVQAAEAIAEKFPTLPSEAGNVRVTDDELYGQMIARKLSTLPEGEEKESLKLDIQVLI
ncbi:uncharacterized protein [Porites lutea]|uniref:uncharacterized protein n=1 Tax=Porites lutea TaxID=51062 RepID=UPI003CC68F7D